MFSYSFEDAYLHYVLSKNCYLTLRLSLRGEKDKKLEERATSKTEARTRRGEWKGDRGRGKWPAGYEVSNVNGNVLLELAINSANDNKKHCGEKKRTSSETREKQAQICETLNSTYKHARSSSFKLAHYIPEK